MRAGELTGVTAISRTNVWVFGAGGFEGGLGTWHFNGHRWTKIGGVAAGIAQASALSRNNIWAIGSTSSPGNAIVHYNGSTWRRSSATALTGAQFNGILALSRKNVWVAGESRGGSPRPMLVHWNGTRWKRATVPGSALPGQIIPDGGGGIWMTAHSGSGGSVSWALHRSRSGTWTRTRISSGAGAAFFGLALIPGTTSLWGSARPRPSSARLPRSMPTDTSGRHQPGASRQPQIDGGPPPDGTSGDGPGRMNRDVLGRTGWPM